MSFVTDLDTPLLRLSPKDAFTLRDATQGVHIWGGIGSGKTSGSGKVLASAFLCAGMGGLVCTVKPEDVEMWMTYARANGRGDDVIVFDGREGHNFIDYDLARHGMPGISNVVESVIGALDAADFASGNRGASSDPFWGQSKRQILNYTVPVLYAAHGTVTVSDIIKFVMSAAIKAEHYMDEEWASASYAAQTLKRMANNPLVPIDEHLQRSALEYFFDQFPRVPEKTRGSILISLSANLDRFKTGRMRTLFCDRTTIVPEMAFHGKIIVMAMPVLTHNEDGLIGQIIFKNSFQKAVESRNGLERIHQLRPVFLWCDESQHMVTARDDEFLSTCRGSRCCMVYLTQTLPSYYAKLGKDKTDAADGLVGKFSTQIFHQNSCPKTNEWASKLIGRGIHYRKNESRSSGTSQSGGMNSGANTGRGTSSSSGGSHGGQSASSNYSSGGNSSEGESFGYNVGQSRSDNQTHGTSEVIDNIIEPNFFASRLKSGGPSNRHAVTAVWFKAGGSFKAAEGGNFLVPTFRQSP